VAEDVAPGLMLDLCRTLLHRYGVIANAGKTAR